MTPAVPRPPRRYLAVLCLVSAAMLGAEVLLVRLFEFSHWHHFAGLAVSLALLGLGTAGTCLVLLGERAVRHGDTLVRAGILIQAAGLLLVLLLHARVAIRPLFAAWDTGELLRLLAVDFAAFVPFFGAGLVIGGVFSRWPGASPSVYAANLLGSGAGSAGATLLLAVLTVERVLAITAVVALLAAPVLDWHRWRDRVAWPAALLGVLAVALVALPPAPAVSDFKALSRVMDLPDVRRLEHGTGLHGRLTVVRSDSLRSAPGLSLQWTEPVPAMDGLVIGSDRLVPLPRLFPPDAAHMRASLVGLPFRLRPRGDALVLGASAWQSPVAAGDRPITWLEPDERILHRARDRGLAGAGVELTGDGAYRFLTTTDRRFEVVALDAAFAGGDAASEDYLLTVEGLAAALQRLTPSGILVLPLEVSVPPRRVPRALATLRGALERLGVERPGHHVAALRGLRAAVILASPRPLADTDHAAIRRFAAHWRFDLVWLPDLEEADTNRYHRLDTPVFHRAARAVFEGAAMPDDARWFELRPADLDKPYFWRSLAWQRIPDFLASMSARQALSYLDWTLILNAVSAALAALLALLLIVAPLGRLPPAGGRLGRGTTALFFAALGLGYMLLELAMFQRAILFVGEPVTTAALVFAVFMVGSGFGSMATPAGSGRASALRLFGAVAAGLGVAALVLWLLAEPVLALPTWGRLAVLAAALAAPAWAMGRVFPWALRRLAGRQRWVPWAWAVNGFASVVAASLATLVSVHWGQTTTVGLAAACYIGACLIALRWAGAPSRCRAV